MLLHAIRETANAKVETSTYSPPQPHQQHPHLHNQHHKPSLIGSGTLAAAGATYHNETLGKSRGGGAGGGGGGGAGAYGPVPSALAAIPGASAELQEVNPAHAGWHA